MQEFSNSKLISVEKISPNKTENRTHDIDTITIHCAAGHTTAEALGNWFAGAGHYSANYGIGDDGAIGLYVEEKDRAWTSYSSSNDNRAITIEVACNPNPPYAVAPEAYAALIKLVADVCRRNGIKKLLWENNKNLVGEIDRQNMTLHRWFVATACPGEWLIEHHPDIVEKVNAMLSPDIYRVQVGAFHKSEYAMQLRDDLRKAGYKDAFVVKG